MTNRSPEALLDQIETQLAQFSKILTSGASDGLPAAALQLQAAALEFAKVLQGGVAAAGGRVGLPSDLRWRVQRVAAALGLQRESLARCGVVAEQALAALLPATRDNTYAPPSAVRRHGVYASAGRASGELRGLAA